MEEVKGKIAEVERELKEAKDSGFPIDLIVALNNRLTELQKKENILLAQEQGNILFISPTNFKCSIS